MAYCVSGVVLYLESIDIPALLEHPVRDRYGNRQNRDFRQIYPPATLVRCICCCCFIIWVDFMKGSCAWESEEGRCANCCLQTSSRAVGRST